MKNQSQPTFQICEPPSRHGTLRHCRSTRLLAQSSSSLPAQSIELNSLLRSAASWVWDGKVHILQNLKSKIIGFSIRHSSPSTIVSNTDQVCGFKWHWQIRWVWCFNSLFQVKWELKTGEINDFSAAGRKPPLGMYWFKWTSHLCRDRFTHQVCSVESIIRAGGTCHKVQLGQLNWHWKSILVLWSPILFNLSQNGTLVSRSFAFWFAQPLLLVEDQSLFLAIQPSWEFLD